MTFKMSDVDRTIRVFNLSADTCEFIGTGDAWLPAHTGLPANCTHIAPPDIPEGRAAVFSQNKWSLVRDYRGETVYRTDTGQAVFITSLGDLPPDTTVIAPEGDFMRWSGKAWVKDEEAEYSAAVKNAEDEKNRLTGVATLAINALQDAVELEMATDDENASLLEWKKYRVLLNRINVNDAPNIAWPVLPE